MIFPFLYFLVVVFNLALFTKTYCANAILTWLYSRKKFDFSFFFSASWSQFTWECLPLDDLRKLSISGTFSYFILFQLPIPGPAQWIWIYRFQFLKLAFNFALEWVEFQIIEWFRVSLHLSQKSTGSMEPVDPAPMW